MTKTDRQIPTADQTIEEPGACVEDRYGAGSTLITSQSDLRRRYPRSPCA
jgi:hypothetical protein